MASPCGDARARARHAGPTGLRPRRQSEARQGAGLATIRSGEAGRGGAVPHPSRFVGKAELCPQSGYLTDSDKAVPCQKIRAGQEGVLGCAYNSE
ncbi:MAG: hypothetical protein HPY71_14570 [Firmicutes bacterium]|nr:hypothetical protein [Bacillota bacterium]